MRTVDERTAGMETALQACMETSAFDIRVAMPGIIRSWDKATQTATVQIAIREKVSNGGNTTEMEIPLLVDVPVVMPRAGGYSLVFAPSAGDECLVVFADCCIDSWWQSGGVQSQAESRRHDLSDGFAILGCWSQTRKPQVPSSGVRLQNDAGTAGVSIDGNTVNLFGHVTINGASYAGHRHSISEGASTTGSVT